MHIKCKFQCYRREYLVLDEILIFICVSTYQCRKTKIILSHVCMKVIVYSSIISLCIQNYTCIVCALHSLYSRSRQIAMLFLQSSELGLPHPLALRRVPPPPFGSGGGAHSLAREGMGESQFRRGDIHCGTLYIYVLCGSIPQQRTKNVLNT